MVLLLGVGLVAGIITAAISNNEEIVDTYDEILDADVQYLDELNSMPIEKEMTYATPAKKDKFSKKISKRIQKEEKKINERTHVGSYSTFDKDSELNRAKLTAIRELMYGDVDETLDLVKDHNGNYAKIYENWVKTIASVSIAYDVYDIEKYVNRFFESTEKYTKGLLSREKKKIKKESKNKELVDEILNYSGKSEDDESDEIDFLDLLQQYHNSIKEEDKEEDDTDEEPEVFNFEGLGNFGKIELVEKSDDDEYEEEDEEDDFEDKEDDDDYLDNISLDSLLPTIPYYEELTTKDPSLIWILASYYTMLDEPLKEGDEDMTKLRLLIRALNYADINREEEEVRKRIRNLLDIVEDENEKENIDNCIHDFCNYIIKNG